MGFGVVLALWVCLTAAVAASPVLFVSIQRGTQSGVASAEEVVVESEMEWRDLWARHAPGAGSPPAADFSRDLVVGVFAGQQLTAGYQVEIVAVDRQPGEIVVRYWVKRPAADALVGQMLTQPFHLVRVPRLGLPVRFDRR